MMEILKQKYNLGSATNLYYWRDSKGVEIDALLVKGTTHFPIEIKATQTYQPDNWRKTSEVIHTLL